MSDAENKTKTAEEEDKEADDTSTDEADETKDDETTDDTEETDDKTSEDEEESKEDSDNQDSEIDYDAEIEAERKRGKPDPDKAKNAFKERKEKREGEDDRPLTKRELQEILAEERKQNQSREAFNLARALAGSDKEAQLVVEKWKNRSFPADLPIEEQIEESYVITHRKKLLGERNEALRALRAKGGVNKNGAGTYRESTKGNQPKTSAEATSAFKAAGFTWNGTSRQFEKKLPNGDMLIRDAKTKQTRLIRKAR